MINILVAHTFELDDPKIAVAEILDQLNLDTSLRKNSVGIISCHVDFLYSDIVEALSEALPFEIVGTTTLASSANGGLGVDILTMSVLTSDEANFSVALTTSLREDQTEPVANAYKQAVARLPEKPSFVLAFGPMLDAVGAEAYIVELNRLCEGVPIFGTLACDHSINFSESNVFHNDTYLRDALVMVLVSGPVYPKFFYISISDKNVQKQKGIITSSTNNTIHTINDMSAMTYLSSLGIAKNLLEVSGSIPLMIDYMDGTTPIGRGIYKLTPNGDVIFPCNVPKNGTIALAFLEPDEVILSASEILEDIKKADTSNGILIFSCISRSLVLGADPLSEAELVEEVMGELRPYHFLYSGGEICPGYKSDGTTINRFHNFSFIACLFLNQPETMPNEKVAF